jgi:hypothetical protein
VGKKKSQNILQCNIGCDSLLLTLVILRVETPKFLIRGQEDGSTRRDETAHPRGIAYSGVSDAGLRVDTDDPCPHQATGSSQSGLEA